MFVDHRSTYFNEPTELIATFSQRFVEIIRLNHAFDLRVQFSNRRRQILAPIFIVVIVVISSSVLDDQIDDRQNFSLSAYRFAILLVRTALVRVPIGAACGVVLLAALGFTLAFRLNRCLALAVLQTQPMRLNQRHQCCSYRIGWMLRDVRG